MKLVSIIAHMFMSWPHSEKKFFSLCKKLFTFLLAPKKAGLLTPLIGTQSIVRSNLHTALSSYHMKLFSRDSFTFISHQTHKH